MLLKIEPSAAPGGITLLKISGRLSIGLEARHLEECFRQLADGKATKLVLDLGGLQYIDSTGLGVLTGAVSTLKAAGGSVRLAGLAPRVKQILEITRMDKVLPVFADVASACDGF
jgi:anti-sigma B factor antagonist